MTPLTVAVLGSGAGGCAAAFDFASHGHDTRLLDVAAFAGSVGRVSAQGGMHAQGALEGFAPLSYAGTDPAHALEGADLVFAVGPAYSTRPFGALCGPHLRPGMAVIVCPGSCLGAVEFKRAAGLDLADDTIAVAETSTLPYAARLVEPGRVNIILKIRAGNLIAAVPASATRRVRELVADVYPDLQPGMGVLHTTLENPNPVIHPAVTVANAAQIERTGGDLLFYEEGVTRSVARLIEAVDNERLALGAALGIVVRREPDVGYEQGYMSEPTYYPGYMTGPGFKGITAQSSLDHRYFNEDAGYGLALWCELGEALGVRTPAMAATLQVASLMMGRDYRAEGARTLTSLGLGGLGGEELAALLG